MTGKIHNLIIIIALVIVLPFSVYPALADVPNPAATASATADYSVDSAFAINNERISLDFRGVDLRDVLSALAMKMGVDIILVDAEPVEINFKSNNITPLQAMELIIDGQGLTYLQNGQIMLVGAPGTLQDNFFDQMILTRFSLYHVPADKIKEFIGTLGVEQVSITVDTNQDLIWVQGTAQVLKKVRELIYAVDTEDSQLSLEYKTLTLSQISTDRAVELLKSVGIELTRYVQLDNRLLVFDSELFSRWDRIETLVTGLDIPAAGKQKVFVYQLKNITAVHAAERLTEIGFGEGVKFIKYNNDKFGKELMVICPHHLETQIRSTLVSLDATRQKTRIPVLTASREGAHASLNSIRSLLSELSGVSLASFHISNNLNSVSTKPTYVLWVEETPDKAQLIMDLIEVMELKEIGTEKAHDKEEDSEQRT